MSNAKLLIARVLVATVSAALLAACVTEPPPVITPATPEFADSTQPPNPVDHRIYADWDPTLNAIWIEWKPEAIDSTSGYQIYRALDSSIGTDGLLAHAILLTQLESADQLNDPLPTSFRDTMNIQVGVRYWYQLRAFYRSPTNTLTYSSPTQVDNSTSFRFETRVIPLAPSGPSSLPTDGLKFLWSDPDKGGTYQIVVERTDSEAFVWSGYPLQDYGNTITETYSSQATPLVTGGIYRWRVKRIDQYGGSSSPWTQFTVTP